ncbi:hypothetical protein C8R44DRAFT_742979 [Mycena epipterygia]|nr:hypothetical protein C8R44DRAFT_742979 [Mycena epipterygia]
MPQGQKSQLPVDQLEYLEGLYGEFETKQAAKGLPPFWVKVKRGWFNVGGVMIEDAGFSEADKLAVGKAQAAMGEIIHNWYNNTSARNKRLAKGSATGQGSSGSSLKELLLNLHQKRGRKNQCVEIWQQLHSTQMEEALRAGGFYELMGFEQDGETPEERRARMKAGRSAQMKMRRAVMQKQLDEVPEEEQAEVEMHFKAQEPKDKEGEVVGKSSGEEYEVGINKMGQMLRDVHTVLEQVTGWVGATVMTGPVPSQPGKVGTQSYCFGVTPAGNTFEQSFPDWDHVVMEPLGTFGRRVFDCKTRQERTIQPARLGEDDAAAVEDATLAKEPPREPSVKRIRAPHKKKPVPVPSESESSTPMAGPSSVGQGGPFDDDGQHGFTRNADDDFLADFASFDWEGAAAGIDTDASLLLPTAPPDLSGPPLPRPTYKGAPYSPATVGGSAGSATHFTFIRISRAVGVGRPRLEFRVLLCTVDSYATSTCITGHLNLFAIHSIAGFTYFAAGTRTWGPAYCECGDAFTFAIRATASTAATLVRSGSSTMPTRSRSLATPIRSVPSHVTAPSSATAAPRATPASTPPQIATSNLLNAQIAPLATPASTPPLVVVTSSSLNAQIAPPATPASTPPPVVGTPICLTHTKPCVPTTIATGVSAPLTTPPRVATPSATCLGTLPRMARIASMMPRTSPPPSLTTLTPDNFPISCPMSNAPHDPTISRGCGRGRGGGRGRGRGRGAGGAAVVPWIEVEGGLDAGRHGGEAKRGKGRLRKSVESSALLDTTNQDEEAGGEPVLIYRIGNGGTMCFNREVEARKKEVEAAKQVAKEAEVNAQAVARGYWELPNPNGEMPTIVMPRIRKPARMPDGSAEPPIPIKATRAKKAVTRPNPHAASEAVLLAESTAVEMKAVGIFKVNAMGRRGYSSSRTREVGKRGRRGAAGIRIAGERGVQSAKPQGRHKRPNGGCRALNLRGGTSVPWLGMGPVAAALGKRGGRRPASAGTVEIEIVGERGARGAKAQGRHKVCAVARHWSSNSRTGKAGRAQSSERQGSENRNSGRTGGTGC